MEMNGYQKALFFALFFMSNLLPQMVSAKQTLTLSEAGSVLSAQVPGHPPEQRPAGEGGGLKEVRILVTDFGAAPDSRKDATPAIARALAACKEAMSPTMGGTVGNAGPVGRQNSANIHEDASRRVVLVFPKGRYDLYPDSAVKKEYFISNTSSETECPSKIKTIGLLLEDIKGLTIEGNGSSLQFHGKMITFVLDHCANITVQGLEIDFERPTMSEFTITRSAPAMVEVQVHPDSWYRLDSGVLTWYGEGWDAKDHFCIRVDTVTKAMYYANDEYEKLMRTDIREITPFRLQFRGAFDTTRYPVGNVFTVRDPIRDQVGALIVNSKDISLKEVAMHYMHGLGIVSQYSENISMDRVLVEPRKGSGRWIASFADGMHFSGCRGQIRIENCRFSGLHDDAVNVHGTHLKIVRKLSDQEWVVRFMHPQTYGFNAFFAGDSVALVHPPTLAIHAYGIVQKVRRLNDREFALTLAKVASSGARPSGKKIAAAEQDPQIGQVVENITWTPSLIFRNNKVSRTNTRGMLVTTRRKVLIEGNEFDRVGMHAILIADDALSWYESGPVKDVLIRGNVFRECGYNSLPGSYAIAIAPENHELTPAPVHRNIRIEKNQFINYNAPVLTARSVEGLTFTANTVSYVRPFADMPGMMNAPAAEEAMPGGKTTPPAPARKTAPVFNLVSCRKVVITNNHIDPALLR